MTAEPTAQIVVYTLPGCRYCARATALLVRKGLSFHEVDGSSIPDFRRSLLALTGASTVPQVVIDGEPIGGSDELVRLDRLGVLDARVRRASFPIEHEFRRASVRAVTRYLLALARGDRSASPVDRVVVLVDRRGRVVEAKRRSGPKRTGG